MSAPDPTAADLQEQIERLKREVADLRSVLIAVAYLARWTGAGWINAERLARWLARQGRPPGASVDDLPTNNGLTAKGETT